MQIWLLLILTTWLSCSGEKSVPETAPIPIKEYTFPYDLESPDTTFKLPYRLAEISGLGLSHKPGYLSAVQDEKAWVLFIDKLTGEVLEDKLKFGKDGDYEGVEYVEENYWVVKSNGNLYRISNPGLDNQKTKKYETGMNKTCDVEGLGVAVKNKYLLIACKGPTSSVNRREVYSFDMDTGLINEEPAFVVDRNMIKSYGDKNDPDSEPGFWDKILSRLYDEFDFRPSGIAVHPKTDNVYICSSASKLLVVLNQKGKLLHLVKLKKSIFEQPEGIVFDADGVLFISNEGGRGKARIHVFQPSK